MSTTLEKRRSELFEKSESAKKQIIELSLKYGEATLEFVCQQEGLDLQVLKDLVQAANFGLMKRLPLVKRNIPVSKQQQEWMAQNKDAKV